MTVLGVDRHFDEMRAGFDLARTQPVNPRTPRVRGKVTVVEGGAGALGAFSGILIGCFTTGTASTCNAAGT